MDPSSFTIVVRTPDQKFQDVNIQLSSDCTIKELKRKIECNHPDSPKATMQKLIYDGKMLIDHHRINSVIKESNRVVHLVYSCADLQKNSTKEAMERASNLQSPELRQRFAPEAPSANLTQPQGGNDYSAYSQAYSNWLQQYQQHYGHYMQYYAVQNPYFPTAPTVQPLGTDNDANGANNQRAAAVQEVEQQNADAGFVVAEENGQDWLDAIFALTRFVLLMSIVYFYSTTYRFIIAVSLLLIIYLYQAGVFQVDRRPGRAQEENPNNPQNEQPATDDNNNNDSESNDEEPGQNEQPPPPPPSIFATAVCFIRSFFSSLVPTGPPAVVN